MREVLRELMGLSRLLVGCFVMPDILAVESLSPRERREDLLAPKLPLKVRLEVLSVVLVRWIVGRLGGVLGVWREPDLTVLVEAIRLVGLRVFGFDREVIERGAAGTLGLDLRVVARRALGAGELLLACRLFWLVPPDLRLWLRVFFAKTGSMSIIETTSRTAKAVLTLCWCLGVAMVCLLSLRVIQSPTNCAGCLSTGAIAQTDALSRPAYAEACISKGSFPSIRGANLGSGNENSSPK
jgi:hypothetical protein